MPHINAYVRDKDWPAYVKLKKSKEFAKWLHKGLQKSLEPPIDVQHFVTAIPDEPLRHIAVVDEDE